MHFITHIGLIRVFGDTLTLTELLVGDTMEMVEQTVIFQVLILFRISGKWLHLPLTGLI